MAGCGCGGGRFPARAEGGSTQAQPATTSVSPAAGQRPPWRNAGRTTRTGSPYTWPQRPAVQPTE